MPGKGPLPCLAFCIDVCYHPEFKRVRFNVYAGFSLHFWIFIRINLYISYLFRMLFSHYSMAKISGIASTKIPHHLYDSYSPPSYINDLTRWYHCDSTFMRYLYVLRKKGRKIRSENSLFMWFWIYCYKLQIVNCYQMSLSSL